MPGFLPASHHGAFLGAPLVARELEEKVPTAWPGPESVTRLRWLGAKSGLRPRVGGGVVLRWCCFRARDVVYHPGQCHPAKPLRYGHLRHPGGPWSPSATRQFRVALGCLMGMALRRTLPAMGATLLIWGSFRYDFHEYLRPHLLAAHTVLVSITKAFGTLRPAPAARVLGSTLVNGAGRLLSGVKINPAQIAGACRVVYYSDSGLARCLSNYRSLSGPLPARQQLLAGARHRAGRLRRFGRRPSRPHLLEGSPGRRLKPRPEA